MSDDTFEIQCSVCVLQETLGEREGGGNISHTKIFDHLNDSIVYTILMLLVITVITHTSRFICLLLHVVKVRL